MVGKDMIVNTSLGEEAAEEDLAPFVGYCAHKQSNKKAAAAGKLEAVSFYYHQQWGEGPNAEPIPRG